MATYSLVSLPDACPYRKCHHAAIVLKAREMHLDGATVLRRQVGFGHSTRIHTTKIPVLSQNLPLVVEIVDSQEKIDQFLPVLDTMMTSGLLKYSPQALRRRA